MDNRLKPILAKDFWKRIQPQMNGELSYEFSMSGGGGTYSEDNPAYIGVKQSDFMREYDISGHKIMSPVLYPDIIKIKKEKGGREVMITEKISRVAFSFQQVILTKQLTALCGNPTKFRVPNAEQNDKVEKDFAQWREGWSARDMDILIHSAFESLGKTGDVAIHMYLREGKLDHVIYSYDRGDILYPHYDSKGKLILFARKYNSIDEDGNSVSMVDIFDSSNIYTYISTINSQENEDDSFLPKGFSLIGYRFVNMLKHGMDQIPIAYHRDESGAWWTPSQHTIEEFEWSFSMMAHNNKAYAFPILVLKGNKIELTNDIVKNTVKAIVMPNESSDAKYLEPADSSNSFDMQLKKLYDMIFLQSFAVNPPEVRSGDLPGVAIKLLYSPSIEKASEMAKKLNPFLDKVVAMFTHIYGVEVNMTKQFLDLNIYAYQVPYVHQNDNEIMKNLETGVLGGFVSKKTATEESPYSNNNEIQRLKEQEESLNKQDLLEDIKRPLPRSTQNEITEEEEEV